MAKEMISAKLSELQKGLLSGVTEKMAYIDGKRTDKPEAVVCTLVCPKGLFDLVLEYQPKLMEQITEKFPFGTVIDLERDFDITDISFSGYGGKLTVKVLGNFKEDLL